MPNNIEKILSLIDIPNDIPWGPTGEQVYQRTYSRVKPNGDRETWPETVARVVWGNLALVHGDDVGTWTAEAIEEARRLGYFMVRFGVLPAGRHLWATGVKGRQYLFNCHVAPWGTLSRHVEFVLMRLAEGGGVGANYSTKYLKPLGAPARPVRAHVVCDPSHPDYDAMRAAGVLSEDYSADWPGTFEVEDTREGWAAAIIDLIEAAYDPSTEHYARVFDVSRVRWSGARLKTMGGSASGPEPLAKALRLIGQTLEGAHLRVQHGQSTFNRHRGKIYRDASGIDYRDHPLTPLEAMFIDHAIADCIVAGGTRRSARMSIVHWDDPYVFRFIECKANHEDHWTTNISVEIDDEFIAALGDSEHPAHEHANNVHNAVVKGMLTNGEPGYWNSSLSNVGEPNEVVATNPCGEIALREAENCNLGHVNLSKFVDTDGMVDHGALVEAHRLVTRFLIRATFGDVVDDEQARVLAENRRIGVGQFGVQGFLNKQGIKYSEAPSDPRFRGLLANLALAVDKAADEYAHDLRIPVPVKKRTMAPTGSIAKMPGDTEGGHPVYARRFVRRVRYSNSDPAQVETVHKLRHAGHHTEPDQYAANTTVVEFVTEDSLVGELRERGIPDTVIESVDEISLESMLAFQAMYQELWADNAVSFTVNVEAEPEQADMMGKGYTHIPEPSGRRVAEVADTLSRYLSRLKGTTLMLDGSRPQAPYERLTDAEYERLVQAGTTVSVDASYDEECASGACPVK